MMKIEGWLDIGSTSLPTQTPFAVPLASCYILFLKLALTQPYLSLEAFFSALRTWITLSHRPTRCFRKPSHIPRHYPCHEWPASHRHSALSRAALKSVPLLSYRAAPLRLIMDVHACFSVLLLIGGQDGRKEFIWQHGSTLFSALLFFFFFSAHVPCLPHANASTQLF